MSSLEGSDSFELSHLPPDNQLNMHVDCLNLRHCLERGAQTIWDEYCTSSPAPPRARFPWQTIWDEYFASSHAAPRARLS